MNDLLSRCATALRDTTADEGGSTALGERIELELMQVRIRRRRARMVLAALGVTVLAGLAPAATLVASRMRAATGSQPSVSASIDPVIPVLVRATVGGLPAPVGALVPDTTPLAPRHHPSSAPSTAVDPGARAYAAAHRSHFAEGNWRAALVSWERYLALAPAGALAPEAHWNRAICLIRLGRYSEARTELQRFRAGAWGSYRQPDAGRLIEWLDERDDSGQP